MPRGTEESKGKKLFDVEKPGKTPPNASSRPLIVGHHTLLQDPMIRDSAANELQPSTTNTAEVDLPQEDKPSGADSTPAKDTSKILPPSQTNVIPPEETEEISEAPAKTAEPDSTDEEIDEKPDDQDTGKKSVKAPDDRQGSLAEDSPYKELIETKKYFVPVGVQKRKRSARRLLLAAILILLLAIALGDLLIDAGVVKTDIKPPVSIFKSNQ